MPKTKKSAPRRAQRWVPSEEKMEQMLGLAESYLKQGGSGGTHLIAHALQTAASCESMAKGGGGYGGYGPIVGPMLGVEEVAVPTAEPSSHPQAETLRAIAQKLIEHAHDIAKKLSA